jgi:hypothetical protein
MNEVFKKTDEISVTDRLTILKILYPTLSYDLLFYPSCTEELLDELGIPKYRTPFIHVISTEKYLKNKVNSLIKRYFDKIYK